jgi:hypothetical protein
MPTQTPARTSVFRTGIEHRHEFGQYFRLEGERRGQVGVVSEQRGKICNTMWMSVAITATIFAVGNILFGHFNEGIPKWKRVTKVVLVLALVGVISAKAGPVWGLAPIALMLVVAAVVHLWWLPRHGINGLTGEPREKYYELKGWPRKP